MDRSNITPMVYTPFADLDLLYGEAEHDTATAMAAEMPAVDTDEPETVDAFNAQILAGLVAP